MARFVIQTLTRNPPNLTLIRSPSVLIHRRSKSKLIEVDLASDSDGSEGDELEIHFGVKKLEDAIHRVIVRRSAPDWLPFIPGSSYWVPSMVQLFGSSSDSTVFETMRAPEMTIVKEEGASFPYFAEGALPQQIALPLTVKKGTTRIVKRKRSKKAAVKSDDDEE